METTSKLNSNNVPVTKMKKRQAAKKIKRHWQLLYEAVMVDGASIWKRIWHIDIPGIMPTAIILLILSTSKILNVGFEKVLLLQNQLNMQTSDIISTYVYRIGLVSMQYSYSSAIGLMQSAVSLILIISVNALSKKLTDSSLW